MNEFVLQGALVLGVLATLFVGPGLAVVFLLMYKRKRRARRRSPIHIELLRSPGHTLKEQVDEAANDLVWDILILSVMPLLILTMFLGHGHVRGLSAVLNLVPLYAVFAVAFIAWMIRKLIKAGERLDRLRTGYDAELAVGQELDQLMRSGAIVFHDFPADKFNIDHVVIAAEGIFAVETKGYTKSGEKAGRASASVTFDGGVLKFPDWTTKEPLEQAQRQADWLAKWLTKAVGEAVSVLPVLALPGWFVERTGRSHVRVFSARALGGLLKSSREPVLPEQLVQRISHQIEQRCRTVVPTYRRDVDAK